MLSESLFYGAICHYVDQAHEYFYKFCLQKSDKNKDTYYNLYIWWEAASGEASMI